MATYLYGYDQPYPPVTHDILDEIVQRIRAAGKPIRILMFGSRARGDHKPDSDLDIFVIENYVGDYHKRQSVYQDAIHGLYPEITIIVRSPQEVEQWKYVPGSLETTAMSQGKILWSDTQNITANHLFVAENEHSNESIEYKMPADLARQIFEKANVDLFMCNMALEHDEAFDMVCFHAQQAAEKYLKGLISLNKGLNQKTHDLQELIEICKTYLLIPELQNLELTEFSKYAITARYDESFWPDRLTAEQALEKANHIIQAVLKHIPPEALPKRNINTG